MTDRAAAGSPPRQRADAGRGRAGGRRLAVWAVLLALALALPLAALALLAEPELDLRWEYHRSHFLLVVSLAAVNVGPRPSRRRAAAP